MKHFMQYSIYSQNLHLEMNYFKKLRRTYGDLSNSQLEEAMAEGFREYVMSQDTQSLGTKIINFFKELFAKVN